VTPPEKAAPAASEWRRSGHLVALAAAGLTCAPTTLPPYTIGIFVTPFARDFGWSRGAIQTAILFSTGLGVLCAPAAGAMIRRFGIRRTILSGLAGMALACLCGAAMQGALWQLYLVYAFMALLGAGAGGIGWTTLLAERFTVSRGLALGIGLSGTGLCAVVMPQIASASLAVWGWRGAYAALAAFALLVVLPFCAWLLPTRREEAAAVRPAIVAEHGAFTVKTALRHWRFWTLGVSTACIYLAVGGAIPNLVPALTDKGVSARDAATVMSIFGGSIILGRIGIGALVDRFWAPAVASVVLAAATIGCIVLANDATFLGYAIAAAMLGMVTGTELDIIGFLTARYFGLGDFARIYARVYIFVAGAAGVAPLIFGHLSDVTGSYQVPFLIGAGLLVAGAIGLLSLGRYPDLSRPDPVSNAAG
jgi:MFS family permease